MLFTTGAAAVMSTVDDLPLRPPQWMRTAGRQFPPHRVRQIGRGVFVVDAQAVAVPVKRLLPYVEWHQQAACRGVADADTLFFGVDDASRPPLPPRFIRRVRAICASCPVQRPCLTQALATPEPFGIWAGTTGRQRVTLRQRVKDGESVEQVVDQWLTK